MTKNRKKPMQSTTLCLTFDTPELPVSVNIGFRNYRVKIFIPKTLQCYKCQRYGHHSSDCGYKDRCRKCGQDHKSEDCDNSTVKCANCKGDHSSNSKDCPWFHKTKQANKVMVTQKMTFREAIIYNNKQDKIENKKSEEKSVDTIVKDKNINLNDKSKEGLLINTMTKESLVSFVCQVCTVFENTDKNSIDQRQDSIIKLCSSFLHLDITKEKLAEIKAFDKVSLDK